MILAGDYAMGLRACLWTGLLFSAFFAGCGGSEEPVKEMKPTDVSQFADMKAQMISNVKKTNRNIKLPSVAEGTNNASAK